MIEKNYCKKTSIIRHTERRKDKTNQNRVGSMDVKERRVLKRVRSIVHWPKHLKSEGRRK